MRKIKFRGKRLNNGEWAYGAFVPDELEQTHGKMVTWGFVPSFDGKTWRLHAGEKAEVVWEGEIDHDD